MPTPAPPRTRPLGRLAAGLGAAALLGVGLYYWLTQPTAPQAAPPDDKPPPSPPAARVVTSPYLNVDPAVKYTGDASCATCHGEIAETYRKHPMGRSLRPVAGAPQRPGRPFDALGVRFEVEHRGNQVVHRQTAHDPAGRPVARTEEPVAYEVGSGTHAHSYLIEHDGVLTQSPVSWFAATGGWDLSPGYATSSSDRFERPIVPGCLFCHCNHADAEPDTLSTYRKPIFHGHAIGCERCHGPGELHVKSRTDGRVPDGTDRTIVNPARLEPALREDVCSQCHLGGKERVQRRGRGAFDFRPGLPLDEFVRVFVVRSDAAQGHRVAGHVEQMHASKCFQQSAGKLGCVSCHDPHAVPAPEAKEEYYRARCLSCHATRGCSVPEATRRETTRGDSCAACHMRQAATNVGHVALSDHRIPRRADAGGPPRVDAAGPAPPRLLVPFGRDALDADDAELTRDWAVALVARARTQSEAFRPEVSRAARPHLERAARAHPDDLPVRESLGVALAWQGDLQRALAEHDATLAVSPRRELVLSDAGVTAAKLGLTDRSLDYWRRAAAVNPSSSRYRYEAATQLAMRGDSEEAIVGLKAVLARNGGHVGSRVVLMQLYYRNGLKAQARDEWTAILALRPPDEAELRRRFEPLFR